MEQEIIQEYLQGASITKLIDKYKGTLKDDQIIGQLIPYSLVQKNHTAYTEIILTNKNILANYIDDYAFPISDEKIV